MRGQKDWKSSWVRVFEGPLTDVKYVTYRVYRDFFRPVAILRRPTTVSERAVSVSVIPISRFGKTIQPCYTRGDFNLLGLSYFRFARAA